MRPSGTHRVPSLPPVFFRFHPSRLSIREAVELFTRTPATRPRYSRLWGSVAAGRSSRSASKSLLPVASIFSLELGRFFGARDRPGRGDVALD